MANAQSRPLSPHIQIYRWGWTMSLSILHRATGLVLALGTLLLTGWVIALAMGPDAYQAVEGFVHGWFGKLILAGWSLAFFYHLCNGIRHLFWDLGKGFELHVARRSAAVVIVMALLLTAAAWLIAVFGMQMGGAA